MKKPSRLLNLVLPLLLTLTSFGRVAEAANPIAVHCQTAADIESLGLKCLEGIFDNALSKMIVLIGIGSFVFLLIGGFRYVAAGGDQKSIDAARKTITYAVVGLLGSVAIYFIFQALMNSLGLGGLIQFYIPF